MKITKITFNVNDGHLTVWTDAIENMGFNFPIDDIIDKADLKAQTKTRVNEFLADLADKATKKTRAETFKSLEGQTI